MWVMDVVFVGLLVQEVEHVFDGQRQSAASMSRTEDGFKQIVNKLLQRSLEQKDESKNLQSLAHLRFHRVISIKD